MADHGVCRFMVSQEGGATMVGIVSGHDGQNVVRRVVRGRAEDSVHVRIHPLLLVAAIASDWDWVWKLRRARPNAWELKMMS